MFWSACNTCARKARAYKTQYINTYKKKYKLEKSDMAREKAACLEMQQDERDASK
jgi:hypothetical protein